MAVVSTEILGMIGLHPNPHSHPQITHRQDGYAAGLSVRSMTPSSSESDSSSESPDGSASDRQSPALQGDIHRDPVHDPSPTKSEQGDPQTDNETDSSSSDTSMNEDGHGTNNTNDNGSQSQINSGNGHHNSMDSNEIQNRQYVIKQEPVFDRSGYSTPVNSRQTSHSPFDLSSRFPASRSWQPNASFESPTLPKMPLDTPPAGQRSQAMKRNFSEAAFMSHAAAQQAMFAPMMMIAQLTGSEAMASMGGVGMIPHPWMLGNIAMATGHHGKMHDNHDSHGEGTPLDLSSIEVPAKKLRRTPSPARYDADEPVNLTMMGSRGQESKKSSLPGGAMQQRHLEDLVKRQLSQKEALKLQEVLYYEHMLLVTQLTCRSEVEGHHGSFQRLHHIYMMEVDRIEKERYKALMGNVPDVQRQATLTNYDQERLTLVLRIKQEVAMLLGPSQPSRPANQPTLPIQQAPQPLMHPMGWGYPWKQSSPPDDDCKDKIKKFLSPGAVKVLMEWYVQNEEHPYPEEDTVQHLAMKAKVSPAQVKKWMANKRVRSSNTLSHNGSIHPKKLQKVLQIQEMARWMTSPEQQQQQQQPPQQGDQPRQVMSHSAVKKSKRALNPTAVEAMNRWYFSHLHYPYPTDEEKMQLAREGNITVAQVTCWFANKRNRSNNAKKFSPVLLTPEEKVNLYQGLKKQRGDPATSPNGYIPMEGYDIPHDPSYGRMDMHHQNGMKKEQGDSNSTSPTSSSGYHPLGRYNAVPDTSYDDKEAGHQRRLTHSSSFASSTEQSLEGSGDEGRLMIDETRPQMLSLDSSPQSPVSH